jgi:uncharacterized protein YndB with AHSA1/START domain
MARDITLTRRFAHPPERVFGAWTDPAVAARWLFKTPTGRDLRCELDVRVGGRLRIVEWRPEVGDAEHVGEYEVVKRPSRLVFTIGSPQYAGPITRVTIEIAPAPGGCDLTLTQHDLPDEWVEPLKVGWMQVLEGLDAALG